MYKHLLILLALSSGSLCNQQPNLTAAFLNVANEYQNVQPGNNKAPGSSPSITHMNGYYNYHADQQIFFINGIPQTLHKGIKTCMNSMQRDDYVITPDVGAFKLHTRKLIWNQARKSCMEEGGHLAILNSLREEEVLLNWMRNENIPQAWLGVHDQFEEGDWVTLFGDSLESSGYNKWTDMWPNQPDNYGGRQNCGVLLKDGGGMDDIHCDATFSFFCEIELC